MKPVAKVLLVLAAIGFTVVCAGAVFVACAVSHLHISGGSVHSGVEANRVETHEIALDPGQPLRAQVDCGSIRVTSTSGTTAQVVARLRAFGEDKDAAEKRLAETRLELGQNSVSGNERREHGLKLFEVGGGELIDLELTLPAGTRLEIHSGSGDVSVQGPFGDTNASSDYGDVAASGIRGALIVKSSSGSIHASEIQGPSATLGTEYGDVALSLVRSSRLDVHTSSGSIDASEVEAEAARIRTDYGDIRVRQLKCDLESQTSSGSIAIADLRGACRAHSDYGDVEAAGSFRGLELSSGSGSVHGRALPGSALADGWELRSDYGEVALQLPEGLSFDLDATTDYGEVHADLPGALGGAKGDETKHLHGAVGGGGPKLRLHSSSGDVEIRTR
jgi:Putative adhesin